jgi:diketogulonate reductase-like aldo/keto reductase
MGYVLRHTRTCSPGESGGYHRARVCGRPEESRLGTRRMRLAGTRCSLASVVAVPTTARLSSPHDSADRNLVGRRARHGRAGRRRADRAAGCGAARSSSQPRSPSPTGRLSRVEHTDIFPLAIGTYGLGAQRTESQTPIANCPPRAHSDALRQAYEGGANLIETSYAYAGGSTMRFLADFIRSVPRETLFITVKIERLVLTEADVERQLHAYLHELGIEYADVLLLHMPSASGIPILEAYGYIANQVTAGKARHIGASNLGIDDLRSVCRHYKLVTFEALYNLECKMCEDVGLLAHCAAEQIAFLAYKPLRYNRTAGRNYPVLVDLSRKHGCTQNQVILSWLVHGKGVLPLLKAGSPEHVRENLHALDVELDPDDIDKLDRFRSAEFDAIPIDWTDSGGTAIYRVASSLP